MKYEKYGRKWKKHQFWKVISQYPLISIFFFFLKNDSKSYVYHFNPNEVISPQFEFSISCSIEQLTAEGVPFYSLLHSRCRYQNDIESKWNEVLHRIYEHIRYIQTNQMCQNEWIKFSTRAHCESPNYVTHILSVVGCWFSHFSFIFCNFSQ